MSLCFCFYYIPAPVSGSRRFLSFCRDSVSVQGDNTVAPCTLTLYCLKKYFSYDIEKEKKHKGEKMDSEKERLILDGNAFYEIDLSCLREKKAKGNNRKADLIPERRTKI